MCQSLCKVAVTGKLSSTLDQNCNLERTSTQERAFLIRKLKWLNSSCEQLQTRISISGFLFTDACTNKLTWMNCPWFIRGCARFGQSWGHQVPGPGRATLTEQLYQHNSYLHTESRAPATQQAEHWSPPYGLRTRSVVLWQWMRPHLKEALQRQQLSANEGVSTGGNSPGTTWRDSCSKQPWSRKFMWLTT